MNDDFVFASRTTVRRTFDCGCRLAVCVALDLIEFEGLADCDPGWSRRFPENGGLIRFALQTGKLKNAFSPLVIIILPWTAGGGTYRHGCGGGGNEFTDARM